MKRQKAKPAVFLDRDGCLIEDKHYLSSLEDIRIYPDVPGSLRRLSERGFLLIVITNQSGVAKGYFTEDFVRECFQHINQLLKDQGACLDVQFYSPYHPNGQAPYNKHSACRKPGTGMLDMARAAFDIDLERSWVIGDKISDVEFGLRSGIAPLHLLTGHGRTHTRFVRQQAPNVPQCASFAEAVDFIMEHSAPCSPFA